MKTPRSIATRLAVVCGCTFSMMASAATFDGVYVFGDSLSDIGRVLQLTSDPSFPGFPLSTGPLPPDYATGRFSNGPVAVEKMTQPLTGSALTLSHDCAFGGARTGISPFDARDSNQADLNGTGLRNQVSLFHNTVGGLADPNALYVVWAGANDFKQPGVLTNFSGTQWNSVIGNITTAIGNLAADGAKHFFVPNIPNLG